MSVNSLPTLNVEIDRPRKTVRFSGPGTFSAKESIKALGAARWNGEGKYWEVQIDNLSVEYLQEKLPIVNIHLLSVIEGESLESGEEQRQSAARGMGVTSAPEGISVKEMLSRARTALSKAFPGSVCLYGVVSKIARKNGRVFIDLTDKDGGGETVSCCIWNHEEIVCKPLTAAGFSLDVQLDVMFEASVGLNVKRGDLSLTIIRIVAEYTLAKLQAQREITNKRLKEEGLFDKNRSSTMAFLPRRLGILTSGTGTVINDFVSSLEQGQFGFELFWLQVSVQGTNAKKEILSGINALARASTLDAILLFRGGGSPAELGLFNDYEIARAICLSPIPVVTAIGHEEDQCSAQDVSWKSFGVPKEIGWWFAQMVIQYRRNLSIMVERIVATAAREASISGERLTSLNESVRSYVTVVNEAAKHRITSVADVLPKIAKQLLQVCDERSRFIAARVKEGGEKRLVEHEHRLNLSMQRIPAFVREVANNALTRFLGCRGMALLAGQLVERSETRVSGYVEMVQVVSPEAQLRRGFTLLRRRDNGRYVTTKDGAKSGDRLELEFHDGSVSIEIE